MFPNINKSISYDELNPQINSQISFLGNVVKIQSDNLEKTAQVKENKKNNYQIYDEKFFNFKFIIDEKKMEIKYSFNIDSNFAKSVEDVLIVHKIYKAFLIKKIKINGIDIFKEFFKFDEDQIEDVKNLDLTISFWEKIRDIEKALGIKLKPSKIIKQYDAEAIEKVYRCFVEHKPYKENINSVDSLKATIQDCSDLEKAKDAGNLFFTMFQEESFNLCGKKLKFYCAIGLFNMQLVSYEKLNKVADGEIVSLKVKPFNDDKISISTMLFLDANKAESYRTEKIDELRQAELLK